MAKTADFPDDTMQGVKLRLIVLDTLIRQYYGSADELSAAKFRQAKFMQLQWTKRLEELREAKALADVTEEMNNYVVDHL